MLSLLENYIFSHKTITVCGIQFILGNGSLDLDADMLDDKYVEDVAERPLEQGVTNESSKFTIQQLNDGTIILISLYIFSKNPNEGRIIIYRKNAVCNIYYSSST